MARQIKVLIVEDDPYRMERFREIFKNDDLTWAKTAEEGIKWLKKVQYDLVMFDHDLAEEHYHNLIQSASVGQGTGREVAKYMVGMSNPPQFAFVHSWNPTGAKAIGQILADGGISHVVLPFGSKALEMGIKRFQNLFRDQND